jgi:Eukaryotic cytochrome b561
MEILQTFQTIVNWWMLPLSGADTHDIAPLVAWHARLMVLAWSVMIPLGVLVARFYKVTPLQDFPAQLDNPFWWHAHRVLQYSGVVLALIAVVFIWQMNIRLNATNWHALFGYVLLVLGLLQIIGAHLRGTKGGPTDVAKGLPLHGDHYDMTRRRRIFEWLHKRMGYAALALTVLATALGLALADAPRWMALVISLWWLLLVGVFLWLQKRGRAVDTYAAIWGKSYEEMRVLRAQ